MAQLDVEDGFSIAKCARCFDFFDGVGDFHEPFSTFEEARFEIRSQAIANDGDIEINGDIAQLMHDVFAQELAFVDEDTAHAGECIERYLGIGGDADVGFAL